MTMYILGYLVFVAKWTIGALLGLSVYMALVSLRAAIGGGHADPDPIGLAIWMCAGALFAFV